MAPMIVRRCAVDLAAMSRSAAGAFVMLTADADETELAAIAKFMKQL